MVRGGPGRATRTLTADTANGLLSFSNMDLHNGRTLYVQRAWEIDLIRGSMEYLAREGRGGSATDVLIDAGANLGMICIAMLKHGYFHEAIAIEPGPDNLRYLTRNIAQNGMEGRIRSVPCALSDRAGEAEMELSEVNFGDHRVRSRTSTPALMGEGGRRSVTVPLRTLDEILTSFALDPSRIGLIWIDVQGFDGYALRGARGVLSRGVPVVDELWPYGVLRSGMDRGEYLDVLRASFARVAIADPGSGEFRDRDFATLPALFEGNSRPEQALAMIGLPR